MKLNKYLLFSCLFLFSVNFCRSQTRIIEKLKNDIAKSPTPAEKLQALLLLCDQGYSLHPDTLMAYAVHAGSIGEQLKDAHSSVKALYYTSVALTNKGLIDSSLNIADKCLDILQNKIADPLLLCNVLNQKGRCYVRKNQYKEAIEMGYKIMGMAEKLGDDLIQVKAKTLIGWAYLEMGQPKEALEWHLNAMRTASDSALLEKYAILFANLASNYNGLDNLDSAFFYIKKGIRYSRKHENLFSLSNSLAIESELFVRSGQPKLSEPVLKEVVAIRKLIGDPFYIASDMAQLGYYYAHFGQPEKGIVICKEGIAIAKQYHLDTKLFFLYNSLADNYKAMGNSSKYAEVLQDIISLKDAVFEKNTANALAEMQAKYEVQKKENTIIKQRLDLVTKNYWLYGSMILSGFGILFFYLLFKNYRKKEKLKTALMMAEEKRLTSLSIKEAEENERRRIAADLHDNLGAYAASIVANLDTISNEQQFNAKTINALKELNSNSQSIVSQLGDTIWVLKRSALSLTAISDRIKLVLQKVQPSYPETKLDVVEKIVNDHLLPPVQAFHIFQTIQEAVINALKHSGCNQLTIVFTGNQHWEIIIEDDGVGMQKNVSIKSGGNGIPNMIHRSKEAGFEINWLQNNPSGTIVQIRPVVH